MKDEVVPNDSRYIPLTQQEWLCVPTCIQMIMLRNNIPLLPAELIVSRMRLIIPEKDKHLFWNKNIQIGRKPKAGYGTQLSIHEGVSFINNLLEELKIPLKMKKRLIDQFKNINQFNNYLKNLSFNDLDIIVCLDSGIINYNKIKGGHVCILDKVDVNKNEVRLINPSFRRPKWQIIKMEKLFQAMKVHGEKNGAGFWEFSFLA